jgi:serine/threonine-protein kinase
VGEACRERVCALRGYHFIPLGLHGEDGEVDTLIGQRCGDYLLTALLGAGGFGKVFKAIQLPVGMAAAVKLLDFESGPAGMASVKIQKLEIEAQALARLSHPNIVRLYQFGQHKSAPFLAMELIEGAQNLWTMIESRAAAGEPLRLDEVEAILLQVIAALEAAHERQIIHRDIKPENVMLQSVAGHGLFVKVLDFGLAKFTEDRNATSMLLGTPAYMAHEQLTRGALGPWTDVYAVGVLAFELLTGRRPYGGAGIQETLALKLDPAFDPWSRVSGLGLPDELRVFFAHAMARETAARFADVRQFRAGLGHAIAAMRAAGGRFAQIPLGRLVEPTIVEPTVRPEPSEIPLDPTRRVGRPRASVAVGADGVAVLPPQGEAPPPAPGGLATPPTRVDPPDAKVGAAPQAGEASPARPPAPAAASLGRHPLDDMPTGPATREASRPGDYGLPRRRSSQRWLIVGAVLALAAGLTAWLLLRDRGAESVLVEEARPGPSGALEVRVPAGGYVRGSSPHDDVRGDDEDPHEVVLGQGVVVRATEITQAEWAALYPTRPSRHEGCGATCPVESVSWWDAVAYANALSEREGRARCYGLEGCRGTPGSGSFACRNARFEGVGCDGWRLPTEAEWEYLARAGRPPDDVDDVAWFADNGGVDYLGASPCVGDPQGRASCGPHPVAQKKANGLGLFDTLGNVREWVHDAYAAYPTRARGPLKDPVGPGGDGDRVVRGGSFRSPRAALRAAAREHLPPSTRAPDLGFRLVRAARSAGGP